MGLQVMISKIIMIRIPDNPKPNMMYTMEDQLPNVCQKWYSPSHGYFQTTALAGLSARDPIAMYEGRVILSHIFISNVTHMFI